MVPIPGDTIGVLNNAMAAGRISPPHALTLLPEIRALAQSTNLHAASYAAQFLQAWRDRPAPENRLPSLPPDRN